MLNSLNGEDGDPPLPLEPSAKSFAAASESSGQRLSGVLVFGGSVWTLQYMPIDDGHFKPGGGPQGDQFPSATHLEADRRMGSSS